MGLIPPAQAALCSHLFTVHKCTGNLASISIGFFSPPFFPPREHCGLLLVTAEPVCKWAMHLGWPAERNTHGCCSCVLFLAMYEEPTSELLLGTACRMLLGQPIPKVTAVPCQLPFLCDTQIEDQGHCFVLHYGSEGLLLSRAENLPS